MADRQRVVASWRSRLAYWRERLEGRRPWVARAYVRVLSFLLARYSPGQNNTLGKHSGDDTSSLSDADAAARSRMAFYQAPAVSGGKPARTGDAIRGVLEGVSKLQPQRELTGPLVQGLGGDDWIAVAAFYDEKETERLRSMLEAAQIAVRVERDRRMRKALVRAADKELAKAIVLEHAADCRDSSGRRKQYAESWMRAGGACGAVLGGLFFAVGSWIAGMAPGDPRAYLFLGLFGGMLGLYAGMAVGFFAGTIADG